MTDQRYFWGNTLASFSRSSTPVVEDTTSGRFDSTFVPNAILIPANSAGFIQTMPFVDASSTTTLWLHFELYFIEPNNTGQTMLEWRNSSGIVVARAVCTPVAGTSETLQIQYWNGSAFTNIGSTVSLSPSALYRFDIKLTAGASGTVDVYLAGSNVISASGMNVAVTNFGKVTFYQPCPAGNAYYSQVLGSNFDTRDSRWLPQLGVALGTKTDGSGAVTAINETVLDESTSISLPTSTNQRSFTHGTLTLPSGYMIGAVCVSGRGRINGSGPSDGKFGVYDITAATSYLTGALGLNGGYEPRGAYFLQNPNTAADWSAADYNDIEFLAAAA